jgi:3-hydroxyisobutyrate dehydrogenase-like beta-hydroxyacid dehydrogenase
MDVNNVAFLGTGLLGGAMVERMLKHGDAVRVWNRTESKARALEVQGASVAATPADAVNGADRVHLALAEDSVVDEVIETILPALASGAVIVDHSTTSPVGTGGRQRRLAMGGVRFLHAPVFMSPQMCRDGVGQMMVSGALALFEQVKPALERMTGEVWYVGDRPDLAACYKLFGNSLIFTINAGLADVLAMARGLDVPVEDAIGVFSHFKAGNAILMRGEKMARGDLSAMFELMMARKDLRLMLEAAGDEALAVLPAIGRRMDDAIARGHGRDDLVAIGVK